MSRTETPRIYFAVNYFMFNNEPNMRPNLGTPRRGL